MKLHLSSKSKLMLSVVLGIALVLSGTLFALGKTGVINIRSLADTVTSKTQQLTGTKSTGATVSFMLTSPINGAGCLPLGSMVKIVGNNGQRYSSNQLTNNSSSLSISGVAPGNYIADTSANVSLSPFTITTNQNSALINGTLINCNYSGETHVCPNGQHFSSSTNTCVNDCTANSCPVGQSCNAAAKECSTNKQLFGLRGTIKDGTSGSARYVGGATVTVVNKTDPNNSVTLATGTSTSSSFTSGSFNYNYQTSTFVLPNNSYENIYLTVTSPGKQSLEIKLSNAGSIVGTSSNDNTSFDQIKNLVMSSSTGKIDIQGTIKDNQNNLIANMTVTTGCSNAPESAFEACKAKLNSPNYPYAISRSSEKTTHANSQNYFITDVFDFSNETDFNEIKLYFQLPSSNSSYYFDANNNGTQDSNEQTGGRAIIPISKSDIKLDNTSGQNSYVLKDVIFKKVNLSEAEIFGKVTDKSGKPLPNAVVGAKHNGYGKPNSSDITLDNVYHSDQVVKTDINGLYSIKIPSNPLYLITGNKYQVCAQVDYFRSSNPSDNSACFTSNGEIATLNLAPGQRYEASIKIETYNFPAMNEISVHGHNTTFDQQSIQEQGVTVYLNDILASTTTSYDGIFDVGYILSELDLKSAELRSNLKFKIIFSKYAGQFGSFYIDKNDNWLDDEGENIVTLTGNDLVVSDGKLVLNVETEFKQNYVEQSTGSFKIRGQFRTQEPLASQVEGVDVTVTYPNLGYRRSAYSSLGLQINTNLLGQEVSRYNLETDPIYAFNKGKYHLLITPPDGYTFATSISGSEYFTYEEISSKLKDGVLYLKDIYLKKLLPTEIYSIKFPIKFLSADDGSEISVEDVYQNFDSKDDFECKYQDNSMDACLTKSPEIDKDNNLLILHIDPAKFSNSRSIEFFTENNLDFAPSFRSMDVPPVPSIEEPYLAVLIDQKNRENAIYCKKIDNIDFCTYRKNKDKFYTQERLDKMAKVSKIISTLAVQTNTPIPDIFLLEPEKDWSAAYVSGINPVLKAGNLDTPFVIWMSISKLEQDDLVESLVHEFGHIIDNEHELTIGKSGFQKAIENAVAQSRLYSCNYLGYFSNYAVYSEYGSRRYPEFWAEFFTQWVLNGNHIKDSVNTAANESYSSQCSNLMKYIFQLTREYFPNLKMYALGDTTSQSLNSSQTLADKPTVNSTSILRTATAKAAASDEAMLSLGFSQVSMPTISSIVPILSMTLTGAQIASGTWLQSNYNTLPLADKVALQINIAQTRASNLIASASSNITTQLANINQSIENLMTRLGIKITNTKIAGVVKDQNGPVEGMTVTFSNKVAVTDNQGKYSINRTKAGNNLKIDLSDSKISKNYASNPKTLTILENQQLLNTNLSFNRPSYQLKGKIYQGNITLAKGQMIIDGTRTVTLNAKGEFDFKLKEGQHKIIIRNSKGKTLTVSNPGKFNDLGKFKNTQNVDGLIWVK